ncbi:hypothetical protein NFI96_021939 [Prochilodus magdalenae]|nr:hypothetical protein NFI96_021939 [Prochilodus magdalenae]
MHRRNKDVLHTYTVSVRSAAGGEFKDDQSDLDTDKGDGVPVSVVLLLLNVRCSWTH